MRKGLILAAVVTLASGCHHARVSSLSVPNPDYPPVDVRVDKFFWGLIAPAKIELARLPAEGCPGGITQTVEAVRWWHAVAAVATVGLYTPYDLIIECSI